MEADTGDGDGHFAREKRFGHRISSSDEVTEHMAKEAKGNKYTNEQERPPKFTEGNGPECEDGADGRHDGDGESETFDERAKEDEEACDKGHSHIVPHLVEVGDHHQNATPQNPA